MRRSRATRIQSVRGWRRERRGRRIAVRDGSRRPAARSDRLVGRALHELALSGRLARIASRTGADVVVASSPSMFLGPIGLALARVSGARFVWVPPRSVVALRAGDGAVATRAASRATDRLGDENDAPQGGSGRHCESRDRRGRAGGDSRPRPSRARCELRLCRAPLRARARRSSDTCGDGADRYVRRVHREDAGARRRARGRRTASHHLL